MTRYGSSRRVSCVQQWGLHYWGVLILSGWVTFLCSFVACNTWNADNSGLWYKVWLILLRCIILLLQFHCLRWWDHSFSFWTWLTLKACSFSGLSITDFPLHSTLMSNLVTLAVSSSFFKLSKAHMLALSFLFKRFQGVPRKWTIIKGSFAQRWYSGLK